MTTDPAFIAKLKAVYAALGIWREGHCAGGAKWVRQFKGEVPARSTPCVHGLYEPHDIPMPPLSDDILAVILRRLRTGDMRGWNRWYRLLIEMWRGADPVEAAVLAFAEYLQNKEEEK